MGITLAEQELPQLETRRAPIYVEALMPDGVVIRINGYSVVQEGRFLKVITAIDEVEYIAFDQAVHVKIQGVLQPPATPAAPSSQPGAALPAVVPQTYVNPAMQALKDGTATRVPSTSRVSGTDEKPIRSLITDDTGGKQIIDAGFV